MDKANETLAIFEHASDQLEATARRELGMVHPDSGKYRYYLCIQDMVNLTREAVDTSKPVSATFKSRYARLRQRMDSAEKDMLRTVRTPFGPILRDALLEHKEGQQRFAVTLEILGYVRDELRTTRLSHQRFSTLWEAFETLEYMLDVLRWDKEHWPEARRMSTLRDVCSTLSADLGGDKRKGALFWSRAVLRDVQALLPEK